jgi:hypothetical protein
MWELRLADNLSFKLHFGSDVGLVTGNIDARTFFPKPSGALPMSAMTAL